MKLKILILLSVLTLVGCDPRPADDLPSVTNTATTNTPLQGSAPATNPVVPQP